MTGETGSSIKGVVMEQINGTRALTLVITIAVLASMATMPAAAVSNTSVDIVDDSPEAATDHSWSTTVDSGTTTNLTDVYLNYTGTGTNVSEVTAADLNVTIDGRAVAVNGTESRKGDEVLAITVENESLSGDEVIGVDTTNQSVGNPATAGEYEATLELRDGNGAFAQGTGQFKIVNTIRGTVENKSSGMIDGASVVVSDDGVRVTETTTGSDGAYELTVLDGDYTVTFDADGYVINETYEVIDRDRTIDATLAEGGTITGIVENETGNSIQGAAIEITNEETYKTYRTNADESGAYSVDVPAGTYTIAADNESYVSERVYDVSVDSVDAEVTENFTLQRAGIVAGTVTNGSGSAIAEASVQVSDDDGNFYSTIADVNGNYSVKVPDGTYSVEVDNESYAPTIEDNVSVTEDETTTVDIALPDAAVITGTVTDENGENVSGAVVNAHDSSYEITQRTETDGEGQYELEVANGTYTVEANADGYAATNVEDVSATEGETTTQNVSLELGATLTGTVENDAGKTIENAEIVVHDDNYQVYEVASTDANGMYSLEVPEGTYTVEADADGYAPTVIENVSATANETTTQNVSLEPAATVAGIVENDASSAVENVEIVVYDDGYQVYEVATTDANGAYSLEVPDGSYTVRADKSGYARETTTVDAAADRTAEVNFTLGAPAVITGTVYDENGNADNGSFVMANDGDDYYFDETNESGDYRIEVPDGNYSVIAFSENETGSGGTLENVETGSSYAVDVEMVNPTILESSVEYVGDGTAPSAIDDIGVRGDAFGGFMMVQLINESKADSSAGLMPHDLTSMGVDNETEFEINLTVEDYDPNSLFHGVRDIEWSATQNETNSNATDITIRTKPVDLQGISGQPVGLIQQDFEQIDWPSGSDDEADLGWENTVYFGLYDLSNVPGELGRNMDNTTIATNAQAFSRPQITEDGLEVYVAGPHVDTTGNEHDGFYSAFIPDAQLESWGVEDPVTDLEALYKGSPAAFDVEETDDGAWIHLDIGYSDGTVAIEPTAESDNGDEENTGGGGGGFDASGSDGDDEETNETDTDGGTTGDGTTDDGTTDETETDDDVSDDVEANSTDDSDEDEPGGDSIPGFGSGATVIALSIAVLLMRHAD